MDQGKCFSCGGIELVKDPVSGKFFCRKCEPFSYKRVSKAVSLLKSSMEIAEEFKSEFSSQLVTLVTAAFGFAAALFWNQAITEFIKSVVPEARNWEFKLLTAVIVTFIAVLAIYLISRWAGKKKETRAG